MIISIYAGKVLGEIQHLFMIKSLGKLGIKGSLQNLLEGIYLIIHNGKRLNAFLKDQKYGKVVCSQHSSSTFVLEVLEQ